MSAVVDNGGPAFPAGEMYQGMSLYTWLTATLPLTCQEDERIAQVATKDSASAARKLEVQLRLLKAQAMLEGLGGQA